MLCCQTPSLWAQVLVQLLNELEQPVIVEGQVGAGGVPEQAAEHEVQQHLQLDVQGPRAHRVEAAALTWAEDVQVGIVTRCTLLSAFKPLLVNRPVHNVIVARHLQVAVCGQALHVRHAAQGLQEVDEGEGGVLGVVLDLVNRVHAAPQEGEVRVLDGVEAVNHVCVIHQLQPALQLEHLGTQTTARGLQPVPAVDGLEQHRVPLEQEVHLLHVQPRGAEVIGHQQRSGGQPRHHVVLQQHAHRIRHIICGLPLAVLGQCCSHQGLKELIAHHRVLYVDLRLRALLVGLEVADDEDGVAVTALDELALRVCDAAVVQEGGVGVEGHVVRVAAARRRVVHECVEPLLVVLQQHVVHLLEHGLVLLARLVGLVLAAEHACELLLATCALPVTLKHLLLNLRIVEEAACVTLLDTGLEDGVGQRPGLALVNRLDLHSLHPSGGLCLDDLLGLNDQLDVVLTQVTKRRS
mmetsp:Transcript_39487/g.87836  ORF Transcript_39487/g.87836 Transcript_39487/m.87836 type:complete len:465 (-) Transcript_39487:566-1960(-)